MSRITASGNKQLASLRHLFHELSITKVSVGITKKTVKTKFIVAILCPELCSPTIKNLNMPIIYHASLNVIRMPILYVVNKLAKLL